MTSFFKLGKLTSATKRVTHHADAISIKIGSSTIHESNQEKLLGVIILATYVKRLAINYTHFLVSVIY